MVPRVFERGASHYAGGVSYAIVPRRVDVVSRIVRDVSQLRWLLPYVADVEVVSVAPSGRAKVRVTHEFGPFRGGYTFFIEFSDRGRRARFWIDTSADENAVGNAWGFLRLSATGDGSRTLVAYGVYFDLGPGMVRTFFESRIQRAALRYPRRLADVALR